MRLFEIRRAVLLLFAAGKHFLDGTQTSFEIVSPLRTSVYFKGAVEGIVHAYFAYRVYIRKLHLAMNMRGCLPDMRRSEQQEQVGRIRNCMLPVQHFMPEIRLIPPRSYSLDLSTLVRRTSAIHNDVDVLTSDC